MKKIKKIVKYFLTLNIFKIDEICKYYKKYTLLPKLMGFKQKPSLKYRLIVVYEYLKLRFYNNKDDFDYILDCIPRIFFAYYLSHKTGHFRYGHECVNKQYFYQILQKHNLPFPNTPFLISGGKLSNLKNERLSKKEIDQNKLFFAKILSGSAGKGAKVIKGKNVKIESFEDFLFQELCVNHKKIKELAPNEAFNTIRVHTYYSEKHDNLEILAAHIKLAGSGRFSDNIGTGGIGVPINLNTGKLVKYGFSEFIKDTIETYPGSAIKFEGFTIPYWDELVQLLEKATRIFKTRLIGWDIGITDKGIVFIEGNSGSDIFIPQVFYRPFYNTLLIKDQMAEAKYHSWILPYEEKYNKQFGK